ncbi:MAG: helix-turn-helix domain-containing protein [Armatimonadota bacterium]
MLGDRLKQARRARHLTQDDLANSVNLSKAAISNYETGKDCPSSGVLFRLADTLNVSFDYFFRTVTVDLGEPAYRKHCSLPESRKLELEAAVCDKVESYLETEALFLNDQIQLQIPDSFSERIASNEDTEELAEQLRKAWGLGYYPIDNLAELLEEHGIKVIFVTTHNAFDGCAYPNGSVPVIVVNKQKAGDRIRFDLAHELGHLLLKFSGNWDEDIQESAANRFAGAFLAPAAAVKKELGTHRSRISLQELHDLKHKYGMSMQAWVYRALDTEVIAKSTAGKLFGMFNKKGWKEIEPGRKYPKESTDRHIRLVARAYIDGIISDSRAAELLGVPLTEVIQKLADTSIGESWQPVVS